MKKSLKLYFSFLRVNIFTRKLQLKFALLNYWISSTIFQSLLFLIEIFKEQAD